VPRKIRLLKVNKKFLFINKKLLKKKIKICGNTTSELGELTGKLRKRFNIQNFK
jgi:hypothetical protein